MILLRSALFAVIFYSGTVIAVLFALPVGLLAPRGLRRYATGWARFHRWCAAHLLGIKNRVEGVVPNGAVLVAAKHQSMYETLELLTMLDQPAIVVKRELTDIPFWGWIARRYGAIPVDRAGSAAALRTMLAGARAAAAEGRAILIFPEGTRVPPGAQPPLRAGFAGLYRMLSLPVVPVALDSGRVSPRGRFLKRPGVVTFRFGAPIPPNQPRATIEARVHAAINALER
ncbi:MAG TPA: lysophospholipid acyltransferase family protein [Sphingomonadaceae bacterium]|nr:lysophospholipid acyltransferase family protein [Sphingomonadaceae bacterium]